MAGNLLSGSELFAHVRQVDVGLPQRGGEKHYCPEDTWLHEKQLQLFHRERRQVLLEERIAKDSAVNKGEWKPELQKVKLIKEHGKIWERMGHVSDGEKFLYPEEAMFLVDQGQMELKYGGVTVSVQEASSMLLGGQVPIHHYQVYAPLCRSGYIVCRHDKSLIVTGYERQLRLDQHQGGTRKARRRRRRDRNQEDHVAEKLKKLDPDGDDIKTDNSRNTEAPAQTDIRTQFPSTEIWLSDAMQVQNPEEKILKNTAYSNWDFVDICLPEFDVSRGQLKLRQPAQARLPPGTQWPHEGQLLVLNNLYPNQKRNDQEDLDFSRGGTTWKAAIKAKNWGEYKAACSARQQQSGMGLNPAAPLWADDISPVVKPQEADSTKCLLDKLKIIQNVHLSKESTDTSCAGESQDLIYDIYLPNKNFRKSDPGPPNYRTCIVRATDEFPSAGCMQGTMRKSSDGVPVLWAVVDMGDVAFYCFHNIDLPQDITVA